MEHTWPNRRMLLTGCAVRLKRDVRHRMMVCYYLHIVARQIGFIGAHLTHSEVAARGLNEPGKLRTVASVEVCDFDAGHNVRSGSAHQVDFDPFVALHHLLVAILRLDPLSKPASREAGRINGERRFDGLQRQAANLDQLFQERCQSWILKVTRDRSIVWRSRDETFGLRVSQVGHKAPSAYSRINLERAGEDHVSQRQARTPESLRAFLYAFAEFIKKGKELFLFVSLRFVVGAPFLLVGFLDGDSFGKGLRLAIVGVFALSDDLDGVNMLAGLLSSGEIGTTAKRLGGVGLDGIVSPAMSALRGNKPSVAALLQFRGCGDYDPALLSFLLFVHCAPCLSWGDWLTMALAETDASNRVRFSKSRKLFSAACGTS